MASRQWWIAVGVAVAIAGCSSSGSATAPTRSVPPPEAAGVTGPTLPSVAPMPTGVPGLDASDPFCAAWAAYAGTLQALGVAASFGNLPSVRLAALELAAAPRLAEIVSAIDASWPSPLATEHTLVIDQRIGPYARRATRAINALTSAGVTTDELSLLRSAWQSSLAEQNPDAAVIELSAVPSALQAKIDSAAISYDTAVTPFVEDPSLLVEGLSTPATDRYLADHCPALASIGVGDAL